MFRGEFAGAFITCVKEESQQFYIVKHESLVNKLPELREICARSKLQKAHGRPKDNQCFLIKHEGEVLRATFIRREGNKLLIYLQDTGETLQLSEKEFKDFYEMPEEIKAIAPLAIGPCKWTGNNIDEYTKINYLNQDFLYVNVTIEVIKSHPEYLINIWPFDAQHLQDIGLCDDTNDSRMNRNNKSEYDFYQVSSDEDEEEDDDAEKQTDTVFTKSQLRSLVEEPKIITENAELAVQGFVTNDDLELCKFYDPNTEACFKGAHCKKVHLPLLTDGFQSRTKVKGYCDLQNQIKMPALFQFYDIQITEMYATNEFMCLHKEQKNKLKDFHKMINNDAKTYKKVSYLLEINDIVLVKFKDKFYRAKVLDRCNENESVPLMLMDFAIEKTAAYEKIYEYKPYLIEHSFFSTEMKIANFMYAEGKSAEMFAEIENIQCRNNGYLKAYPVNYHGSTALCKLYEPNTMKDISEELIARELAVSKQYDNIFPSSFTQIPG